MQLDLAYCALDEVREAGHSSIHTRSVCVSAAQSKTNHPCLHPGPIRHRADERPAWIPLSRWHDTHSASTTGRCQSALRGELLNLFSMQYSVLFVHASVYCSSTQKHKELIRPYLAGVLAALLVSSADHVREDVHLLFGVCLVQLLTWSLGNDWHLHLLQRPYSRQRDWEEYKQRQKWKLIITIIIYFLFFWMGYALQEYTLILSGVQH